jgi:tetratricopeptide (TPR) repeat protein
MTEPNAWEQIFRLAVQFYSDGQLAEAASLFVAILEHNPDHFASLQRLVAIRRQQGRLDESLALLEQAIRLNPNVAEIRNSLGNTLNALGLQEQAVEQYRRAVVLRADFAEAHLNLANSLKALGRFEEAAEAYRAAINVRPDYADAHTNLAVVLDRLNKPDESLASFLAALSSDGSIKLGYNNVGMALSRLNRYEEALKFFEKARQVEPDAPQPVFNEALAHLAMGKLELGWPGYEARWRVPEFHKPPYSFEQPAWDGQSSLSGKTILLHAEQGMGDTILFVRFVEHVVRQGARVVLLVLKPLAELMANIPGVVQVLTPGDPLPQFDLHAPMGSLPLAFKTTLSTIPARIPYLFAPHFEFADKRPLVGVCWAGNPNYPSDHKRSIPLKIFQNLLKVPGVQFVSLQQNLRAGDEEILAGVNNIDLSLIRKASSLADTAALINRLDLVITMDTVIGHLTGALGLHVWILLHSNPYWLWMREREDSAWYPSARLFRQQEPGDWAGVITRAAEALQTGGPRNLKDSA